jgi:hypothetical protein
MRACGELRDQFKEGDSDLLWWRDTHVGTCVRAASSTEPTAAPDAPSSSKAIASVAVLRRRVCMGTADASAARMETVALAAKGELVDLRRLSGVGVA